MNNKEKKYRLLRQLFLIVVIFSIALSLANYDDYIGLLESRNEVIFSINEVTHSLNDEKIEISILFSILNPTSYSRLKFSSLQSQLYLIVDGNEEFMGTTGYSPPFDVPLPPEEIITYTTKLSISKNNIFSLTEGVIDDELEWRIRNVVHFSTPIKRFYQNFNTTQTSRLQN